MLELGGLPTLVAGSNGTRNSELGTWKLELGTRNSEHVNSELDNSDLGNSDSELGTRNAEL